MGPRGPGEIPAFEGIEFRPHHGPSGGRMNSLKLIKTHLRRKNKKNHAPHKAVLRLTNLMDHKAPNQIGPQSWGLQTSLTIFWCPHLTPRN